MKQAKALLLTLAWLILALVLPWLVMGALGPNLERLWAWGVAHLPALIQRWLQPGWMHLVIFGGFILLGTPLLKAARPRLDWRISLLLTTLSYGLVYRAALFLPDISTYPFSLGWSEASRYYYASLYLSEPLYGLKAPLSVLHPTRYLLQAVPFLLPDSPLWLHRTWQVLLWLVTSGLTGWLVTRRAAANQPAPVRMALIMGAILFLFQGPVYYHLLVMVIIVLWGFNRAHPWRILVVVLLASLWAGVSRVNWHPMPGLLAAAMYFLEVPYTHNNNSNRYRFLRYLLPPASWTLLGTLTAWGIQQAYQALSGNPAAYFGSSFSSDLLWYRLLPNPTYPLGILPSALLVSLPILALMLLRLRDTWRNFHPLRLLGLGAILFVLFAGGVIVSVKIGGGSNLHNLDAYLVMLLVIASYVLFNFKMDTQGIQEGKVNWIDDRATNRWLAWLVGLAVAIPLLFTVTAGSPWIRRDIQAAEADLATLRQAAQQIVDNGGELLLINQRHLLTFGELPNIPLVPDYELVFLMEMAMAGNSTYLEAFHTDLQSHRFALIISEPLNVQYQGRTHSFGEENDAWVTQVSVPVLCNYKAQATLQTAGVVLYVPGPDTCP